MIRFFSKCYIFLKTISIWRICVIAYNVFQFLVSSYMWDLIIDTEASAYLLNAFQGKQSIPIFSCMIGFFFEH